MPADGRPGGTSIHATAVAIGDQALLIQGPSRSGKSRLAAALIARSTRDLPIILVGDDRIVLQVDTLGVMARPHPRIAGFIERRGLGLCAVPYRHHARLTAILHLGPRACPKTATHPLLANFPALSIVEGSAGRDLCDDVLAWFGRLGSAARGTQVGAKADDDTAHPVKD